MVPLLTGVRYDIWGVKLRSLERTCRNDRHVMRGVTYTSHRFDVLERSIFRSDIAVTLLCDLDSGLSCGTVGISVIHIRVPQRSTPEN